MEDFACACSQHASGMFFYNARVLTLLLLLGAAFFLVCSLALLSSLFSLLYINTMRMLSAWSTYTVKHHEQSFGSKHAATY
jgi:hypothetical protein